MTSRNLVDEKAAIAAARERFRAFYAIANDQDAVILDGLVLAWIGMVLGIGFQSHAGPASDVANA